LNFRYQEEGKVKNELVKVGGRDRTTCHGRLSASGAYPFAKPVEDVDDDNGVWSQVRVCPSCTEKLFFRKTMEERAKAALAPPSANTSAVEKCGGGSEQKKIKKEKKKEKKKKDMKRKDRGRGVEDKEHSSNDEEGPGSSSEKRRRKRSKREREGQDDDNRAGESMTDEAIDRYIRELLV